MNQIADMLDGFCFQSQFPFTRNDFKSCYDMYMLRQSAPLSCSVEVSVQNSLDKIQTCSELFEYMDSTCVVPNHEVELTELEYPVMGPVYLDPMDIYMEKLFITEPQYCWFWSLIIFLIQRSFLSAVFIPHEVFTPQKYVHFSTRGSVEGGYLLCGVWGQVGVRGRSPRRKNFLVKVYCNFIVNLDRSL
jgi:hypothetical protein